MNLLQSVLQLDYAGNLQLFAFSFYEVTQIFLGELRLQKQVTFDLLFKTPTY